MDFVRELQDLTYLDWADTKMSPGTPGCFPKAYDEKDGERYYYKLSNYDSYQGVFGHECVNELIVSRLLDILDIGHLQYKLIHAMVCIGGKQFETYVNKSVNFRKGDERKQSFDVFYELHRKENESPLDFSFRMGWKEYICQMMAVDYLICNRDRHGVSLLFSCYNSESIRKFDVMEDRPVQSFIGSKSLEYNLRLIPRGQQIFNASLQQSDREKILDDLDIILSTEHLDKIWEMIWRRWERYVQICNQE